jgi:integrase
VYIPQQALTALARWLHEHPGLPQTALFIRPDGTRLRFWHVEWAWRQARAKVGLDDAKFHDLRHAGLTLTAQLGATQAELMRRAGHSSTRAAAIYQHAAESRDRELAERLSALPRTDRGYGR